MSSRFAFPHWGRTASRLARDHLPYLRLWRNQLFLVDVSSDVIDADTSIRRDVGCKTVANMIKGKSPEEIRKLFNIVNDFTPEEEVCLHTSITVPVQVN